MLFYVPPLLPVMASVREANQGARKQKMHPTAKTWEDDWLYNTTTEELWGTLDQARFPIRYMANMFGAGDEKRVGDVLMKQMAVRIHRRAVTVGDITEERVRDVLGTAGLDADTADEIYRMTALPTFDQRFVIPAAHREQAIEMMEFTGDDKGSTGFGFTQKPARGA